LQLDNSAEIDMVIVDGSVFENAGPEPLQDLKEGFRDASIVGMIPAGSPHAGRLLSEGLEDFVSRPVEPHELRRRVERILEHRDLRTRVVHLQRELAPSAARSSLVRRSAAMLQIHKQILHVGPTRSTILILGESGVGKELVARALHSASPRRSRPFIPINCAAIPETLIESELFGHEKGSFTGAFTRSKGKFELAHQGTIFLDEIGEMNIRTQVKLLRVLEGQEFMRVGGNRSVRVDVRVLAATNTDLQERIRLGTFRDDLYFRLKVVTIPVPPLRERQEDIPDLIMEFLESLSRTNNVRRKTLEPGALQILQSYSWPGNVRELKNLLESLIVSLPGEVIRVEDLPAEICRDTEALPEGNETPPGPSLQEMEKELIVRTLRSVKGNRQLAAGRLRIGLRTLQRKIQRYGIDPRIGR
jgi:DNA-binding NtrC family response regulator